MHILLSTRCEQDSEIKKGLEDRLNDKLVKRNSRFSVLEETDFSFRFSCSSTEIFYQGERFNSSDYDLLLLGEKPNFYLAQDFLNHQIPVINSPHAYFLNADKIKITARFQEHGIPVPPSITVGHPSQLPLAAHYVPFPWVVKAPNGEGGVGVFLIESQKGAASTLDYLWHQAPSQTFLIQEFIETDTGLNRCSDIRCTVIGDQLIPLERSSQADFRVNVSRGGHCQPTQLTPQEEDWVRRCATISELEIMGIDFLRGRDGNTYFTEVNHTPMLLWGQDAIDELHLEALANFCEAKMQSISFQ